MPIQLYQPVQIQNNGDVLSNLYKGIQVAAGLQELKKNKLAFEEAEKVKKIKEESVTKQPITQTNEDGMTVNLGDKTVADPVRLFERLRAEGLPEVADKLEESHLKVQEQRDMMEAADLSRAVSYLKAGMKDRALKLVNRYQENPEEQVQDARINGDMVSIKLANGESLEFDSNKLLEAASDVKTRAQQQQAFRNEVALRQKANPVFDEEKGIIYQDNKLTNERTILAKFDSKKEKQSKEQIENAKELWKTYTELKPVQSYLKFKSAEVKARQYIKLNTNAGDLGLTYTAIRVVDEDGKTVTDQDFYNAEKTQTVAERLGISPDLWKKVLTGTGTYSDPTREKLMRLIETGHRAQARLVKNTIDKQWEQRREAMGIPKKLFDPENLHGQDYLIKTEVESSGDKYEPDKYDYDYDPVTLRLRRKAK